LLAELRLSGAEALRDQVLELLVQAGLPVTLDRDVELEHVIFATARDKKRVERGRCRSCCVPPLAARSTVRSCHRRSCARGDQGSLRMSAITIQPHRGDARRQPRPTPGRRDPDHYGRLDLGAWSARSTHGRASLA